MSGKLGEILIRESILTPQQLKEALEYQRIHGGRLGFTLIKLGFVSEEAMTAAPALRAIVSYLRCPPLATLSGIIRGILDASL